MLTNHVQSIDEGREKIRQTFKDGSALKKFEEMIVGQGVDPSVASLLIKDEKQVLPQAEKEYRAISSKTGFIRSIDSFKLGTVVQRLGSKKKNKKISIIQQTVTKSSSEIKSRDFFCRSNTFVRP